MHRRRAYIQEVADRIPMDSTAHAPADGEEINVRSILMNVVIRQSARIMANVLIHTEAIIVTVTRAGLKRTVKAMSMNVITVQYVHTMVIVQTKKGDTVAHVNLDGLDRTAKTM